MDDAVKIITNPYEDTALAKTVLREIEAVLYARGCQLVHVDRVPGVSEESATVLARIVDNSSSVHIAKIFEIVPGKIQAKLAWREIISEVVTH